jgi:hypothetical protein
MAYEGRSEYALKKGLEHEVGKTSWTMPAHVYIALFIGDPYGAGVEVSGTGYARVETDGTDWGAAAFTSPTASIATAVDIDFGTAGSAWGTVTHFAMYDNSTGGNLIEASPLEVAFPVVTSAPVKFLAGGLIIRHWQTTVA